MNGYAEITILRGLTYRINGAYAQIDRSEWQKYATKGEEFNDYYYSDDNSYERIKSKSKRDNNGGKSKREIVNRAAEKQNKEIMYNEWKNNNPLGLKREFNAQYKAKHVKVTETQLKGIMSEEKTRRKAEVENMLADPNSKYHRMADRVREFFENKRDENKFNQEGRQLRRSKRIEEQKIPEIKAKRHRGNFFKTKEK